MFIHKKKRQENITKQDLETKQLCSGHDEQFIYDYMECVLDGVKMMGEGGGVCCVFTNKKETKVDFPCFFLPILPSL